MHKVIKKVGKLYSCILELNHSAKIKERTKKTYLKFMRNNIRWRQVQVENNKLSSEKFLSWNSWMKPTEIIIEITIGSQQKVFQTISN